MTSTSFIRINNVTVSVSNVYKVALEEKVSSVLVFVKDRLDPFSFSNETKEQAISFYVDLCKVIQRTQSEIPFLFFANVALRLELLIAIHIDGSSIVLSTSGYAPDVFAFTDQEAAQKTFDELMVALGIGVLSGDGKSGNSPESDNATPPKAPRVSKQKTLSKKPPDKVPRKSRRS